MNTKKPISTISYNSQLFLKSKLDDMIECKLISFYAFINHTPEDDEAGNKEHIHLFVIPSKQINTELFGDHFFEYVPDNDRPLKCITWRSSDFANWYLYSKHDPEYLASKNQCRRYNYLFEDFVYSDFDTFQYFVRSIDMLQLSPYKALRDAITEGLSFEQFFNRGSVPLNQIEHYHIAYNMLRTNMTIRNGRSNHEEE